MPSTARTMDRVGGRLGLAVAAAVGLVVCTVSTAMAAAAPMAVPTRVSSAGVPTGAAAEPRTPTPGFVLDRGRYTTIEAPAPNVWLFPFDINNRGQLTGEYVRVGPDGIPDSESGFVRDKRGRVTVLDVPGAKGTEAVKLNDRGQVVGEYSQDTPIVNNSANPRDFLWDRGRVITIEIPGADPLRTEPIGVNNRGQVVGPYLDRNGALHGFLWERGRITTIDLPGATSTSPTAINDRGQVLGVYTDAAGAAHGFVLSRGRFVSFDVPGQGDFLFPLDINNRGQIVGWTVQDPVTLAGARGFLLAKGARGPATPVSFPGAPRTIATGINDQGQIVGFYENAMATSSRQLTGGQPQPAKGRALTGRRPDRQGWAAPSAP
jgi:probable HAF family extracellular repeat protein